ncbi:alpha/beta fold hydrolase [Streptomyces stramineus]
MARPARTALPAPGRPLSPPRRGIVLLARTLADRVRAHVPEPLVVLGHSMGALLAYELAWRLQSLRSPALALYACAAFSPAQYSAMAVDEEALADGARALGLSPPRDEGRGRWSRRPPGTTWR